MYLGLQLKTVLGESSPCSILRDLTHIEGCIRLGMGVIFGEQMGSSKWFCCLSTEYSPGGVGEEHEFLGLLLVFLNLAY